MKEQKSGGDINLPNDLEGKYSTREFLPDEYQQRGLGYIEPVPTDGNHKSPDEINPDHKRRHFAPYKQAQWNGFDSGFSQHRG